MAGGTYPVLGMRARLIALVAGLSLLVTMLLAACADGDGNPLANTELRLDELTWTEAGCPSQALFRQEQRMQDALATVERFEVSSERLTLHSEGRHASVFELVGKQPHCPVFRLGSWQVADRKVRASNRSMKGYTGTRRRCRLH